MLSDVLVSVAVRLATSGITAPLLVGRRHLPEAEVSYPGRYVVVPDSDDFGTGATQTFNAGGARQSTIITRRCGAEIHVWGVPQDNTASTADLDAIASAEGLLHAFVRELRAVATGQWSIGGGRWNNDGGNLLYGAEYVARIVVDVPITTLPASAPPLGSRINTTFNVGTTNQ